MRRTLSLLALFALICINLCWAGPEIFLMVHPATVTGPALVQHVDLNLSGTMSGTLWQTCKIPLPNKIGAGNAVIVSIAHSNASVFAATAVSDDGTSGGNTYTRVIHNTADPQNIYLDVYVATNCVAAQNIIVHFTGSGGQAQPAAMKVSEFYNVSTAAVATAVDISNSANALSNTITAGSIAPGTDGDLIYMVGFDSTVANNNVGEPPSKTAAYTVGSQSADHLTWQFASGSLQSYDASFVQYGVQSTHTTFTPTLTVTNSDTSTDQYVSAAIALKPASAGTAPAAGMRIVSVQHTQGYPTSTNALQWATQGNLGIVLVDVGNVTGISSAGTNTQAYTQRGVANDGGGNYSAIFDSANISAGTSTLTLTFSGSPAVINYMLIDVVGAATSPYDTYSNNSSMASTSHPSYSITPTSTKVGIIVTVGNNQQGSETTLSSPSSNAINLGVIFDSNYQEVSLDENDLWGLYYNPQSTSPVTFTWNMVGGPTVAGCATAVSYKAP